MKRAILKWKHKRHQLKRSRSEMKRRHKKYRLHRLHRMQSKKKILDIRRTVQSKESYNLVAPRNFSFVDNTIEVLRYINKCKKLLHKRERVVCNIEDVNNITSDAIALLVACANDENFRGKYGLIEGNAPQKPQLRKLFLESGFYNFVNTSKALKHAHRPQANLLHKESHFHVHPLVAKEACLYGTKHVFHNERPIEELYEMLIEAMSNTNNHASNKDNTNIKWWLYAYNSSDNLTSYSFIDLGVGIFDSIPVQSFKKMAISLNIKHNVSLVQDLLEGKIKSRIRKENEMRGRGIPQIANNSQKQIFKRAYIISNDVKIDLKTKQAIKLEEDFQGTFLYWELFNPQKN